MNLENLNQTINSLDEQSSQLFEHIIIDGHSGDGTVDFLQQLEVKPGRSFISQKDQGIFDAMNKGAKLAKNKYLWFSMGILSTIVPIWAVGQLK